MRALLICSTALGLSTVTAFCDWLLRFFDAVEGNDTGTSREGPSPCKRRDSRCTLELVLWEGLDGAEDETGFERSRVTLEEASGSIGHQYTDGAKINTMKTLFSNT